MTARSRPREHSDEKLPKSGGTFLTPEQQHILESSGIPGELSEQVYQELSRERRGESDSAVEDESSLKKKKKRPKTLIASRMPWSEGTASAVLVHHLLNSGDLKCFQFSCHIRSLLGLLLKTLLWSLP